jgi:hypothetical protein
VIDGDAEGLAEAGYVAGDGSCVSVGGVYRFVDAMAVCAVVIGG